MHCLLFSCHVSRKESPVSIVPKSQTSSIKIINQAFGSLKENIILDINKTLINKFTSAIVQVRKFEFFRGFIKSLPRVIFEFTAVTSIVIIELLIEYEL